VAAAGELGREAEQRLAVAGDDGLERTVVARADAVDELASVMVSGKAERSMPAPSAPRAVAPRASGVEVDARRWRPDQPRMACG
jgi:hypothetical protein